jgi:RHH-type transcriptional regulator, proline utilization regulon repressor / proline dehydrogenase / delta 1-pyrroline-5-carboxylate dehydrogenase
MYQLDPKVTALAKQIAALGEGERARVFKMGWWAERMIDWALAHPDFRTRLFRFVDVFPATRSDDDVLRHLEEYFEGAEIPPPLRLGLELAERVPLGDVTAAMVARRNIRRMARQFIAGETAAEAEHVLHRLWRKGSGFTVDLLGEKTLTAAQADGYADKVLDILEYLTRASSNWAPDDHLEHDDLGPLPRVNLSLKATALSPLLQPLTAREGIDGVKSRLRPVLRRAGALGAFINLDMEHYEAKDLALELFRELWDEPEFAASEGGIVVQAYLRDSYTDLAGLIEWSAGRPRPITIRLVKGAYWDTETVISKAEDWPIPVFESKEQTDGNYERCANLLLESHEVVRAAFGTHNLRSAACAIVLAHELGIPDNGYELQMLYGMAEPVQHAIRRMGLRLRIYAPVGELIPGMAYLVRRLLENTSNESFIRHRFAEGEALDKLLKPPAKGPLPEPEPPSKRPLTGAQAPAAYAPEPLAEWRRGEIRKRFGVEVARRAATPPIRVPAFIGGREVNAPNEIISVDPAEPSTQVARSAACGPEHAEEAAAVAQAALKSWSRTPAVDRAAVLFRAAEWMRTRRGELAALEVFEAGKPWKEADADVCEAIDFCEYYGREMLRLDPGGEVQSPPGESNALRYSARGVTVVISPWNFPLAIPTGMTVAALVAGNPAILKPAEQTPAIAWQLVRALTDSGLPDGVLGFLPGYGEEVGAALVDNPLVAGIAFTGSKAVGLKILASASRVAPGQRHLKHVITEMGGKNAIVVDSDADLDQAVPGIVYSAFGYAGQKCSAASRLILLDEVCKEVLERLVGAAEEILIGHPRHMGVTVGPLIDDEAHRRVLSYVEMGSREGRLALSRKDIPERGYFVGPTIVTDLSPSSRLVKEEIFGPVLSVLQAGSFEEALELANDSEYALTGGIYSRSVTNIRRAAEELRAGNVYVNRPITGAVVGRQPFGGYGLSGAGSKAGGPDYLLQFLNPRTISENTIRQGFAP